ncbi:glycosyltransferase [Mangrovimonas aestuarii]|uniref:glycosyltransferase n=1 Tax=Mangrovimonas aestuarii TaxID=3018443 RepID=UPI0023795620|nr:glycosyltransferase [Mangrovimonas aestuarii]
MKLTIISHTEHYKLDDGTIVGWGPTVTEINHLLEVFDHIFHVAMLHEGKAPLSALPYQSERVTFVSLPPMGGQSLASKFHSMVMAPKVIGIVRGILKKSDCFQLRTPTGIGVYLIPFLSLCVKKQGWYKYAGNWNQNQPPLGYRLQRWMLKQQGRPVTINGDWANQPEHCLTFENPCLTDEDIMEGEAILTLKDWSGRLNCCYVGRLETEKGVGRIIKALEALPNEAKSKLGKVHFVGDGKDLNHFKQMAEGIGVEVVFHGLLERNKVFDIYKKSHLFLMPTTASEGFPKVIAEAMNFGLLPIVSKISSIGQYISHGQNGFLLENITEKELKEVLENVLSGDFNVLDEMTGDNSKLVQKFTFNHYNNRIHRLMQVNTSLQVD